MLVTATWLAGPVVADDLLSKRQINKLNRQLDTAHEEGDRASALDAFAQLATGTPEGSFLRLNALWYLTLSELGDQPEAGRERLAELAEDAPSFLLHSTATTILQLFDELDAAKAEAGALRQRLEEREAEISAATDQLAGTDEAKTSLEKSIASLRRQLAKANEELAQREAELATKDEALQKLKDALVDGGGP